MLGSPPVPAEIGERQGLGAEWLNNSAQQFIRVFKEPNRQPILKSGNVQIAAADERSMLAMNAGRCGSSDRLDINFIVKRCCITSVAEPLELYEEFFPENAHPDRTRLLVDEAISALGPQSP
jgi:hypothetical protein